MTLFERICPTYGLPTPTTEFQFAPPRKWRFDYYFELNGVRLAVEVEGGVWKYGRHNRASGFLADMEKYNRATIAGIMIYRVTPDNLITSKTFEEIKTILKI